MCLHVYIFFRLRELVDDGTTRGFHAKHLPLDVRKSTHMNSKYIRRSSRLSITPSASYLTRDIRKKSKMAEWGQITMDRNVE